MICQAAGGVLPGMNLLSAFEAGVFDVIQFLLPARVLAPILKPFVRLIIGLFVIPAFRLFLHRVVRKPDLDEELEKDISLWLRGSILLLVATANMESLFFGWVPPNLREERGWLIMAGRLLLAVGVIENMPDQGLFSIIHPGPPPLVLRKGRWLADLRAHLWPALRGIFNQHLNRSSAVLAILTVFQDGMVGWVCYALAITNYLIIGLITSRDRALDVLSKFDQAIHERRQEIELAMLRHDQLAGEPLPVPETLAALTELPQAPSSG